jgi:hypothetical protein
VIRSRSSNDTVSAMISKHTKVLFLVAAIGIGTARLWQRHSEMMFEKSNHPPIVYNVDLKGGITLQTNRPPAPRLRSAFGAVGMLALLLALPLLVKDITHTRQQS